MGVIKLVHAKVPTKLGKRSTVSLADHDVCLFIWVLFVQLVAVCLYLTGEAGREVEDGSSPERTLLERSQIVSSHDAKVVASAAESAPEIGVFALACVDDVAGGEDDFVVDDVVADEAFAGREERQPALFHG